MKTRGQLEAEISEALVRFEKEHMGRGPTESQVVILEDMVLIRLQGVLTPAERQLVADNSESGRMLIKQVRRELLEKARPLLEAIVLDVTGVPVKSLHADISTITGERVILFALERAVRITEGDSP